MDGNFIEKYDKKMDYIFSIIFGNTDDEEEDFQGFTEEDVKLATKLAEKKHKKFKSLESLQGTKRHRKSFGEGHRRFVHDQDYRKYDHMEHCKFYEKESYRNQKAKCEYKPFFPAAMSSENESYNRDEIEYLKSWIFRDTDDEDEEFEGFTEEDLCSNTDVITTNSFKKERTNGHSKRGNNGERCVKDEMQGCRGCSSPGGKDEDEGMFSNAESDGEMPVKWFTQVMQVLESSIEKDENDENDQRILRQNLNKVFGLNKEEDILLKIFVKK